MGNLLFFNDLRTLFVFYFRQVWLVLTPTVHEHEVPSSMLGSGRLSGSHLLFKKYFPRNLIIWLTINDDTQKAANQ